MADSEGSDDAAGGLLQIVQMVAKPLGAFLTTAIPLIIKYGNMALEFYRKLPTNFIEFLIGCIFCFFGGVYPTLFAAVQAAENGGRKTVMAAIKDLSDEALIIINESKKDDDVDEDKDGKKDVDEISGREYLQRKTLLVLKKMNPEKVRILCLALLKKLPIYSTCFKWFFFSNPFPLFLAFNQVDNAIYSVYRVWLAVAAVLTLQFARTINMALSIAEFLNRPCDRFLSPTLQIAIPDEYDKWVPVVLRVSLLSFFGAVLRQIVLEWARFCPIFTHSFS